MKLALEVDSLDEIADRIKMLHGREVAARACSTKSRCCPCWPRWASSFPRKSRPARARKSSSSDDFSLLDFPILQCWPQGRRPLHHPAVGDHPRSEDRQAQRRHVSHAGLRRAHHRHALAAPESTAPSTIASGCGARPPKVDAKRSPPRARHDGALRRRLACRRRQAGRRTHGSRGRDRHRSGDDVFGHRSRSARRRGVHDRRLPAPEAGRAGEVRDGGPRSPGDVGDRARRLRRSRRAAASKARSAITPASTRWRTSIRSSTSPASRTARTRSTRRPSSASRRWKTPGWARPSSASSCR